MDVCIFLQCHRLVSPTSRVVCIEHQDDVDAVEARRYGCYVLANDPSRCPHCGSGSIARSYPLTDRVWRCQRPGCTRQFMGGD